MVLTAVASFGYELVQNSWIASAVLIKQLLVLHLAKLVIDEEITLKHLEEVILEYSRPVVSLMVIAGLILTFTGIEITPNFQAFSEITALLYFGFLFWKF